MEEQGEEHLGNTLGTLRTLFKRTLKKHFEVLLERVEEHVEGGGCPWFISGRVPAPAPGQGQRQGTCKAYQPTSNNISPNTVISGPR